MAGFMKSSGCACLRFRAGETWTGAGEEHMTSCPGQWARTDGTVAVDVVSGINTLSQHRRSEGLRLYGSESLTPL
jgi:hypothetical protein